MPRLSIGQRQAILELRKARISNKSIAKQLGFSQRSIQRFLVHYEETGMVERKHASGRPRKSLPHQDAVLEKITLADRKASAAEINKRWRKATRGRVNVTHKTVNNRLLEMKLPARTPRRKPLKPEVIRAKRLQFAKDHADWTVEQWKQVVFSDESWLQERENVRGSKRQLRNRR